MKTTVARMGGVLLIASAALVVSSCQTGGGQAGGGQPGQAPASAPAASAPQGLQGTLAGNSLIGEAISGDDYCSYYAPDGTMTRVFQGFAPEYGSWGVDGSAVCETMNQVTGCSRLDFAPNGEVTVTSLEGSGGFSTPAVLATGNRCGG